MISKSLGFETLSKMTLMKGREKICNRMIHRIDIAVWGHLSAVKCTGLRMVFEGSLVHGEVNTHGLV